MGRTLFLPTSLKMVAALGAASLVWVLVLAYASSPAWAEDITVNSTADTDDGACTTDPNGCTLREAILDANDNVGAQDTIHFDLGSSATIVLGSPLPGITDAAGLTIDGQKAKITLSGNNKLLAGTPFTVASGAKLNLNYLTVADVNASFGLGGAISNDTGGEVEVSNSTFSGNFVEVYGGALYNRGVMKVSNSTFSGNRASDGGGGAIENQGTLEVSNSTFSGNCTGLACGGGATSFGGAIENEGTLEVSNSTFSGNRADYGGAIGNFGSATLKNTIVANSPSGGNCSDPQFSSPLSAQSAYNLSSDNSCGFGTANNSISGQDPKLGALADNGGPTDTMALQSTSPAIDKGNSFLATTDQRGEKRPTNFPAVTNATDGDGSDIGAFEFQMPTLSIDDTSVAEGDGGTTNATFTLSLSGPSPQQVTVDYATADDTATATVPADYEAKSGTLTFAPGETSKTVTVTVDGDTTPEANETFFVNLSNATGAEISDTQGKGTITNDDAATTSVAVDIKPTTCPNALSTPASGTIPVAILGTSTFDVSEVDPSTVRLEGVEGVLAQQGRRSVTIRDVATPYSGTITDPPQANQCTTAGPDGQNDLNLKFDAKSLLDKLGAVTNKEVRVLTLSGKLKDQYGGTPIEGKDVVVINKKK